MGPRVHEALWKPLLESKFGDRYRDIVMSWFWARIHFRSPSLGYIRGGFQQLYDRLVDEIERLGGVTCFNTSVTGVERTEDGTLRVSTDTETHTFDRVISTFPTRLTIGLTPELKGDYEGRYSNVESYGAHCAILALDRPLTDIYWLNVNDPGFPFLALVEHTNYMPIEDYGGRHIVYLGNYVPMTSPLFTQSDEEILDSFLPAI